MLAVFARAMGPIVSRSHIEQAKRMISDTEPDGDLFKVEALALLARFDDIVGSRKSR